MIRKMKVSNIIIGVTILGLLTGAVLLGKTIQKEVFSPGESMEAPIDEIAASNDAKGRAVYKEFQKMLQEKRPAGDLYDFIEKNHSALDEKSKDYCIVEAYSQVDVLLINNWRQSGATYDLDKKLLLNKYDMDPRIRLGKMILEEMKTTFKKYKSDKIGYENYYKVTSIDSEMISKVKNPVVKDFFKAVKRQGYKMSEFNNGDIFLDIDIDRPKKFASAAVKDYLDLRLKVYHDGNESVDIVGLENIYLSEEVRSFINKYPNFIKLREMKNDEMKSLRYALDWMGFFNNLRSAIDSKIKGKTEKQDYVILFQTSVPVNGFYGNLMNQLIKIVEKNGRIENNNDMKKIHCSTHPLLIDGVKELFEQYLPEFDLYGKKSIEILKNKKKVRNNDVLILTGVGEDNEISQFKNGKLEKVFKVNNFTEKVTVKAQNFLNSEQKKAALKSLEGVYIFKKYIDEIVKNKSYAPVSQPDYSFTIHPDGHYEIQGLNQGLSNGFIDEIGYDASGNQQAFYSQRGYDQSLQGGTGSIIKTQGGNILVQGSPLGFNFEGPGEEFVKMKSENYLQSYFAKYILKGDYITDKGEKYSFGEDLSANFNGKKLTYEFNLRRGEPFVYNASYIKTNNGKYYAFKFEKETLYLYETINRVYSIEPEEKPMAVLTKIK